MLTKVVYRWAVVAIAVPLAAAGARRLSEALEARHGRSRTSRMLRRSSDTLRHLSGRETKRRRPRWR